MKVPLDLLHPSYVKVSDEAYGCTFAPIATTTANSMQIVVHFAGKVIVDNQSEKARQSQTTRVSTFFSSKSGNDTVEQKIEK